MEKPLRKSLNRETLAIYWQHVKIYRSLIWLCALGIAMVICGDIVSPIIYKKLFDTLASSPIQERDPAVLQELYGTLFQIGIAMALTWSGWRIVMWTLAKFESKTMKDLSDSSYAYLQYHSTRFFSDSFAGALVKRVNRFTAGFEVIADQFVLNLGQTIVRVVIIIGILFWYNAVLGSIFLAWTIVLTTFNFVFSRYKLKHDLVKADLDTKVTARIADTIANAINLKLFASTQREIGDFKEVTEKHHKARFRSWNIGWVYEGVQGFSIRALELGMLVIAVRYWFVGILTVGDLFMLRSYLAQLAEEVRALGSNVRHIYEALADANEMTDILLTPHEIVDRNGAVDLTVTRGVVEFRSIRFSYENGEKHILKDFALKTKPGEKIGIVGPSGGGKSTVLKILVRLYPVQDGSILIDGNDIAMVTQTSLHRNIAFVPQDPVLFHRSLMENIRYSRPEASDDEVLKAARLAHCHEFISSFPLGYETLVGERGVKLSGGERQRVAIARAILMDAPILVLDEATSSLDSESEMFIKDSLSRLMPGRTVIAVAHRFSTIQKMDRIIVVKEGRIVEEGTHEILAKAENGHYQKLWELQSADHQLTQ